ncbi:IS3 family transposase [Pseudomonas sp. MUP55]|uniref:IS3 family transposase n=1 Tax=Pseudomonas sp. MUP55 TaxID=3087234 RepID=UPI002A5A9B17|nr:MULTISPECIES: IS3 family transposase [unclassified Pseudomonas]WPN94616.1 IS3 family transposase [Pseudomonas sp. MUP56]WPO00143.1 IS3 family transposase [Pseudomonas sp. MUP55]
MQLHVESRESAGARMISQRLKAQQIKAGRYLVAKLMAEANLASKQRRRHQYRSLEASKHLWPRTCSSVTSSQPQLIRSGAATLPA